MRKGDRGNPVFSGKSELVFEVLEEHKAAESRLTFAGSTERQ